MTSELGVIHELEFGKIYINATIESFNVLCFEYIDGVDAALFNEYCNLRIENIDNFGYTIYNQNNSS